MGTVAVVAHSGKTLGGGLGELRDELTAAGVTDPLWFEVPKSKMAPKRVREAVDAGADLIFVWGGDGMVQRCVDALAGSEVALAIVSLFNLFVIRSISEGWCSTTNDLNSESASWREAVWFFSITSASMFS